MKRSLSPKPEAGATFALIFAGALWAVAPPRQPFQIRRIKPKRYSSLGTLGIIIGWLDASRHTLFLVWSPASKLTQSRYRAIKSTLASALLPMSDTTTGDTALSSNFAA